MEENKGEIRQGEEKRNIWSHWKTFLAVIVIIVVAYAGIAGKVNLGPNIATPDSPLRFLVNETVSASAPIVVRIPDGVAPIALNQVASIINFDPEIRGSWRAGTRVEELVFQPAEALTIGRHYSVNVSIANDVATSSTGVLHADFLVAENPAVLAVFPAKESEADESSAITIVFNRPMVPVSTLDEVDANKIPIEITPVTLGRFKWISTRNLQFIPKERLVRSSNYRVSIKNGFTSVEGLPVPAFESTFTTRPLRLNYTSSGQLRYNEPVRLNFNQPVDLARSKGEIVIRNAQGAIVPAIVEYGKGNDDKDDDQSTLLVWPASDSNGRVKFWDLLSNYNVSIGTVYPIEGDINLVAKKGAQINITDIIESFTPRSERTSISDTQLFDPVGTIEVSFFEDIDISRSKINAKGMRDIKYAEKCEEADENGYYIEDCTKVPDKKRIIISWKPEDFGRGEEVSVNFDSITNSDGVVINAIPIKRTLVTYPIFKIIKVIPSSGTGASLTDMTICSNSPIVPRGRDDWRDALVTSGYVAFNYWSEAYRSLDYYQSPCTVGEYRSDIRYGLIPETKYDITLKLTDTFGQTASKQISFTTGKASEFYTRIGSLQSQYEVTSPERTKLTYYTENLEYVNVNICQVSPETMLGFLADRPDITRSGSSLGCIYSKDVVVQLPKRYWVNNYFQFELSKYITNPLGQYVISLGHPSYVQTGWKSASESTRFNIYERTYLSVTRLAVGEKRVNWQDSYRGDGRDRSLLRDELGSGGQSLYWVTRFGSQVPVVGATVSTFVRVGDTGSIGRSGYGVTNVAGVAEIGAVLNYAGAIVRDGLDSAVISTWADTIGYASQAYSQSRTYIYTDRPIYRPTQSVHIKGIDRIAYDGVQKISSDKSATVIVYNSNNEKIAERVLGISAYGTFSLDVLLPRTAPLGTYRVESLGSYGYFDVEEYTPSAFELTAKNEKDEYIAGDTAHVGVDAKYYFGVPLDSGSVEYTIISQDYYFDKYSDEYFSFGRGWYYCYECGYGDRYVKRGTATIDKNGHANIVEKLDLDALFKDDSAKSSKIFVLAITVRDSTGREVTTTKSFIVHRGEFYLGVKTIPYYAGKNETFTIKGKSVDTLGKETNVRGAKLVVNKIVWKTFKRREVDGNFYYRSEETREAVKTSTISTDGNGNWQDSLALSSEGEYEVVLSAEDGRGNKVSATTRIYIWGDGAVEVEETNNDTLNLETEKTNVSVGDTPVVIIKSPYARAKALITVERGKIYHYEVVDITGNIYAYKVPIVEQYIPNVYVSVLLLSGDPAMKYGQIAFQVDRKEKELGVSVKLNKTAYLPGETVEMDIEARDTKGMSVEAELSVAVADLSVLALKGNPKKDPLVFFYNNFPLTVVTATNIKNILHEADIPTGTKGGSGGGAEDLAKRKRGEFLDTAFWKANVVTGSDGKAHLSFKLPDNLTTWQVETLGVTKDTKLGVNYLEFRSGKELSLIPIKPRFVVPGDEFMVGAKIFNQTGKKQTLDVSVKSSSLIFSGSKSGSITISAGETKTIYFDALAPLMIKDGTHVLTIKAGNSEYVDEVEQAISITKNETPEYFATAGSATAGVLEYVYIPENIKDGDGELTIQTQGSIARYMTGALETMFKSSASGCNVLGSKLSTISVLKRALSLPNMDKTLLLKKYKYGNKEYTLDEIANMGIAQIADWQNTDGGFVYYPGMDSSFYLTLSMLDTFADLKSAGYAVDQKMINRAVAYVVGEYNREEYYRSDNDSIVSIAYVLSRVGGGESIISQALSFVSDRAYLNEKSSSKALGKLALLALGRTTAGTQDRILEALENRLDIDTRGAYIKSGKNIFWNYYETPIENTALYLQVISTYKSDRPLTDKVLRFILASRNPAGDWGSTGSTLSVIRAMSEYLSWKRETEANYVLHILFDNTSIGNMDVTPRTVFDDYSIVKPIKDIEAGKLHMLTFDKENRNSLVTNFYYDVLLRYFLPTDNIAPRDEGFTITRGYYKHDDSKFETELHESKQGDVIMGHITITVPKERNYVEVESIIPAGFELVNSNLDTERRREELGAKVIDGYGYGYNDGKLHPDYTELRDDRLFLFTEHLSPGVYTYDYYIRALVPGTFQELPAIVREEFAPENFGRTRGNIFTVNQ